MTKGIGFGTNGISLLIVVTIWPIPALKDIEYGREPDVLPAYIVRKYPSKRPN
jgi:hypothetical protein